MLGFTGGSSTEFFTLPIVELTGYKRIKACHLGRIYDARVEPQVIVIVRNDARHSVMNVLEQWARICDQDCAGWIIRND